MALAPFLLIALLIIASILGIVFVIGLILLIVGIVSKCNRKNDGKKSPVVLIITGIVMMVPSVLCVTLIAVYVVKTDLNKAHWEREATTIVELWQHTNVTEEKAAGQALEALLKAADAGDKEAFVGSFAEPVREDPEFEREVKLFFDEYSEFPGALAELEFDGGVSSGSAEHDRGITTRTAHAHYDIKLGDESYYIKVSYCFENDEHPEQIGVTGFEVMNLGGYVDYHLTMEGRELEHDDYVACNYCTPDEVSARRISGHARRWKASDVELLTLSEMKDVLNSCDYLEDLEAAKRVGLIGDPNSEYHIVASTAVNYYYEIAPEDGEARFVDIVVSAEGKLLDAWVCSEEKSAIEKIK